MSSVDFKIFTYSFVKEDYPPDIVPFTEWRDYSNPYEKYFQQVLLDVDTGGYPIPVTVEGDGVAKQTVTVTSTGATRDQVLTLSPSISARKVRLKCGTIPAGGKFQLFSHDFVWLPADRGPVHHTFDWDDLGWPYDKKLKNVVLEYDTSGTTTTMLMDTLTGIEGTTINLAVQSFVLSGAGRSKQQFLIPDSQIVKMIRIRAQADNVVFKHWDYKFDKIDYPPEKIAATEWDDLGYPCDKIFRELILDVDTGGVNAEVKIQLDGDTYFTTTNVLTSVNDRHRIITLPSDCIGKRVRIAPTAGTGGKFQMFSIKWNWIPEPCAVVHWDSYEQAFGYNGWKFIKQNWVEYQCPVSVTFKVYTDDNQLLHSEVLPAHDHRDIERFYLPAISALEVLNKSKIYRFTMDSCDECIPFKLYRDGTRVEWMPFGADQRQAYQQAHLWEPQPIPIA